MPTKILLLNIGAAVCYGAWPLIMRASKMPPALAGLTLQVGAMLPFLIILACHAQNVGTEPLHLKRTLVVIAAGMALQIWALLRLPSQQGPALAVLVTVGITLAFVSGVVAGTGSTMFQPVIAARGVEIGRIVAVNLVSQMVFVAIAARIFYGERLDAQKIGGIIAAIITVRLLAWK